MLAVRNTGFGKIGSCVHCWDQTMYSYYRGQSTMLKKSKIELSCESATSFLIYAKYNKKNLEEIFVHLYLMHHYSNIFMHMWYIYIYVSHIYELYVYGGVLCSLRRWEILSQGNSVTMCVNTEGNELITVINTVHSICMRQNNQYPRDRAGWKLQGS